MYSKNGIPWVRPPTQDRKHRENNIGRTEQYQTGRSAYLRLGQLFMRLFAGLL